MQTTPNFTFRKPDPTDNYSINDQNTNWDTADTQIKSAQTAAAAAETTANAAIPSTQKAAAGGVATLDAGTLIPLAQIPTLDLTHIPTLDLAHLPTNIPEANLAAGAATDAIIGNRTINDATAAATGADTPTNLWSKLGNMIKQITGGTHWYDVPSMTIAAIATALGLKANSSDLTTHEADYTEHVPYGGATTGPANTYALATPAIAALSVGMAVSVKFNVDSTGASTLNWNGKGAKGIKKSNGTDVTNLKATGIYTLRYDGVNFQLQGEGGEYGTAGAPQVFPGYTVGTENGLVPGTATADATAGAGDIANGKTAYINGAKVTGTGANAAQKANGAGTIAADTTVSGLTFTPNEIIVEFITAGGYYTRVTYFKQSITITLDTIGVQYGAGSASVLTGISWTVAAGTFTLHGANAVGQSFNWRANE